MPTMRDRFINVTGEMLDQRPELAVCPSPTSAFRTSEKPVLWNIIPGGF